MTLFILWPSCIKAQNVNLGSEIELGFTKFQEGDWTEALAHLEIISSNLSSLGADTDIERTVYYACGMCAQRIGELNKSIAYNVKALELPNTPMDMTIQLLCSQLQNYSDLSMMNNCKKIIERMMNIYRLHKYIDLAQSVMEYYSRIGSYNKVIEFEKDLPQLIVPTANTEMNKISNTIQWNTIYLSLAHSFSELRDFPNALTYYQKGLETVTEYNKEMLSVIYASISKIYDLQGDKSSALKYQKLALESEL